MRYRQILGGKYIIFENGVVKTAYGEKTIYSRINKNTGKRTIKLFDKVSMPGYEKLRTYSVARLVYWAFNPTFDYYDFDYVVKSKTNNYVDIKLDDLYLEIKQNEKGE